MRPEPVNAAILCSGSKRLGKLGDLDRLFAQIRWEKSTLDIEGDSRQRYARQICDTDEIATTVVFLASDDGSCITGTELFVDGGFVLGRRSENSK
jgi:NAD(P)-dependent dehydrogenase (short-subunit alcohol dehydrogenase family)